MNLNQFKKNVENQTILKNIVKMIKNDQLILDLNGVKGVIPLDEVDGETHWKSFNSFIGREIYFIVTAIDQENEQLICSRKAAQEKLRAALLPKLNEGASINAKIIKLLNYGAILEYRGVTGTLKNVDFSTDYTAVHDVKKVGDRVLVTRLNKDSDSKRILFEAVEKYSRPSIMNFDMFEPDTLVSGVVRSVKPDRAYVNLAPGLDALCPLPETGEIEEGTRVQFLIKQVRTEEKRIRGKIVRILV